MDIQWVIIADSMNLHDDRSVDISGIRHHVNISGSVNTFPVRLIAKANFSPVSV